MSISAHHRLPFLLCWLSSGCAPEDDTLDWDGQFEDSEACFHREIPEATGEPAVAGTTSHANPDERSFCSPSKGPELRYLWTPDESRAYRIHTGGSEFDTVLYVYEGCHERRIACNDDHQNLQSQVIVEATAFNQYIIVVDGYETLDRGAFRLTIQ